MNTGASRHEIRFAPAPPESARTLTIQIESFIAPFRGQVVHLRGPWEFRVTLCASRRLVPDP